MSLCSTQLLANYLGIWAENTIFLRMKYRLKLYETFRWFGDQVHRETLVFLSQSLELKFKGQRSFGG